MPIQFTVISAAAPQGSKSFKGMNKQGRAIMAESSKELPTWRQAVIWMAREAMGGRGGIAGGVAVSIVFTVRKPADRPKTKKCYPSVKPDIDKLVRSTFDALTAAGAIEDDARVVRLRCEKTYPLEHPQALDVPGAWVLIEKIEEAAGWNYAAA